MNSLDQLDHLETSGLIRLAQDEPELEYLFRHALVQDAAYRSLLRQDRKRIHQVVGETLERLYPERWDEIAPLLGHHFAIAGDDVRALKYFTLAGDTDAAEYANAEAVSHYTRALEIARRSGASGEDLTKLYTRLGRILELDSRFDKALTNYEEMETLAQQRDDRPMALAALMARIPLFAAPTILHDLTRGLALGEEAITLARDLGDQAREAKVLWSMSVANLFGNRLAQAIDCGERSMTLARELDLREQMAFTLTDLGGLCYLYGGRLGQAKSSLREASGLWRKLGNMPMLADSLGGACTAHVYAGEYDQAIALSEEAFQIGQSIKNLWSQSYSLWKVGLVHWESGKLDQAISVMEESIRLGTLAGFLPPQANTRSDLAALYGDLGAVERGLEIIQLALSIAETQNPLQRGHALGILGQLYLLNGDLAKAQAAIDQGKDNSYRESWPVFFVPVIIAAILILTFEVQLNVIFGFSTSSFSKNQRKSSHSNLNFQPNQHPDLSQ
ncbi:MAG: hypothetical protein GY832_05760, partial [Chloroflexi bacterium]|nr:hypothetical protein [Chloroflexota bacterium]